jgi:hypothetical protein
MYVKVCVYVRESVCMHVLVRIYTHEMVHTCESVWVLACIYIHRDTHTHYYTSLLLYSHT